MPIFWTNALLFHCNQLFEECVLFHLSILEMRYPRLLRNGRDVVCYEGMIDSAFTFYVNLKGIKKYYDIYIQIYNKYY